VELPIDGLSMEEHDDGLSMDGLSMEVKQAVGRATTAYYYTAMSGKQVKGEVGMQHCKCKVTWCQQNGLRCLSDACTVRKG
jgi:hypothetical protein